MKSPIFPFASSRHKNSSGDEQKQEIFCSTITIQPHEEHFLELQTAKQTIASLEDKIRRLKDKVQSLEQGQDFRSHYAVAGAPHDKIQQRLKRIRDEIQAWSRRLFKDVKSKQVVNRSITDFLIPELQVTEFGEALKSICPGGDTGLEELRDVKFHDAVAAIASNLVIGQAVMNPLGPCTREMQDAADSTICKMMSGSDASPEHRRAAKIWQASCMKLYNSSVNASDRFGTAEEKADAIEQHINSVMPSVLAALKPAFDHCQLTSSPADSEACQRRLLNTIRAATEIGRDLSELHSDLVLMDKTWLDMHHTDVDGFISLDTLGSRIDLKAALPEGEKVAKGKVSLVLFPGLLKYGSDDGENWESWTVWIPTKVQLTDVMVEGHQVAHADQIGDREMEQNYNIQPGASHIDNSIVTRAMNHGEIAQPQAAVLNAGEGIYDDMNTSDHDTDMAYGDTTSLGYMSDDCMVADTNVTGETDLFRQVMQEGFTSYGARQ